MQILTDFIPKPGDKLRRRTSSGKLVTYIWVVCPQCNNGRWVVSYSVKRLGFTGCCRKCSIEITKKQGWTSLGYRVY